MQTEVLYRLILPVPPPLNKRFAVVHGRMVKSRKDRSYKDRVQKEAQALRLKPIDGPVAVRIHWYRRQKSGDLDGRWKTLFDALQGFAYHDDKQIEEMHLYRNDLEKDRARIDVEIWKKGWEEK